MQFLAKHAELSTYKTLVSEALSDLVEKNVLVRIWEKDHTVWEPEPDEIVNRLGWLNIAEKIREDIPRLETLRTSLLDAGYTDVLLLGMGGSSLAPDVFGKVFADAGPGLRVQILDSTHPGAVKAYEEQLDLTHTLFIVASKSGTTAETVSFFKYFYTLLVDQMGKAEAGQHFVAITDPGSKLAALGTELGFREIFLNNPNLGGRYSVLSYFGMVPAALTGLDVARLLECAAGMHAACGPDVPQEENPAAWLGVVMGELAKAGRDKLTLIASPSVTPFVDWVEQLIAESTGKSGTGILPVAHEPLGEPSVYGDDRLFVYLQAAEEPEVSVALDTLIEAEHPVVQIPLTDRYDLGAQFFLWELATAVAGARLGIQPFNQPNVEAAKKKAKRMIKAYRDTGSLPSAATTSLSIRTIRDFLARAEPGDYVAIQAYVQPKPEAWDALQRLRLWIREHTHLATTLGYGPRYLHSTGQLHKGDRGNGLFIQFAVETQLSLPIPDLPGAPEAALTFDVLIQAQANGDYEALKEADRRVIRYKVEGDIADQIEALIT